MVDNPTEWDTSDATGVDAYTKMVTTLTMSGIVTPPVPAHLVSTMRAVDWAWGTTPDIQPFAAYFDAYDVLDTCLDPGFGDFWMYAHRGHGINSYGIGMIARLGGLQVLQQH